MAESKFHDCANILSYNKLLNFDVGGRSIGKSFSWKMLCVNTFLRKGRRFMYVRRYKDDIETMNNNNGFWGDIGPIYFKDHKLETEAGNITRFKIDKQICGYGVGLNQAVKLKSMPFPDVDIIFLDEAIAEDGKYLGGAGDITKEPRLLMSLIMTVARGDGKAVRDNVRVGIVGNTHDRYNPYFIYFGISEKFKEDTKVIRGPFWVVMKDNAPAIAEEIAETQIGKMLEKTGYGAMALGGNWEDDNTTFVEKVEGEKKYFCSLMSENTKIGVYACDAEDVYYFCDKVDDSNPYKYALSTKDQKGNFVLAQRNSRAWKMQCLSDAWKNNKIRFQTALLKRLWAEYMHGSRK